MNILGLSAYYHDSAACLVRDGAIVAAAQEERFTRKKHDSGFPRHAVAYCLREAGIDAEDLDLVGFYEKPLQKFNRIIETFLSVAPRGLGMFLRAMPLWLGERLWIADDIEEELGCPVEVLYGSHHDTHGASAFYPSPFEEAAILSVDAVGEWATASLGRGKGNAFEITRELRFPHSLGMLYSAFTYYTGFRVNSGEYKVMGLAPYGEPKYTQAILDELVDLKPDGSFRLNMDYFGYLTQERMISRKFEQLFGGPPRKPDSPVTQRDMDLARSVQDVTETILLRLAGTLHDMTGLPNLCMAGGVSLNCVANGRILRETPFENLFVQPAAGDAGGALGMALFLWHRYAGNARTPDPAKRDGMQGALLGPAFNRDDIERTLKEQGVNHTCFERAELTERVAELIAAGHVVGWFQGRMEYGPRALGNRSILGDPRNREMQRQLNLKIKFRESFRPFAPSVLKEHAAEYFDLDCESPYMLLVTDVAEAHRVEVPPEQESLEGLEKLKVPRSDIPAVTHVDCSARVQTVSREDNPLYHELISAFHRRTGCPVVINTSFNVRGEPIVCTPEDAYRCFLRTEMDFLALGPFLIDKADVPAEQIQVASQETFAPD